jgi:hypothetical protein
MGISGRLSPKDHGDPQRRYKFVDQSNMNEM